MVSRISSPRFIGRAEELDALERVLAHAESGSGGAVLVVGEAGIGKSRLVGELEERARTSDVLVLVGECVELAEGELSFAPIISALRSVMEDEAVIEGLSPPLRSAAAALWPVLGGADGIGGREQLFEAVYRVLARLATTCPVLLIMEDVHWIDPSSRDLLAFLVRNARQDPIAIVATFRPDELHRGHPLRPFLAELERSGRAERVELEPLDRAEVAEQLAAIAGSAPGGAVVDRIFVRCEGNPFFAEELLASADTGHGELPRSLREGLLLRVEQLSEFTRDVLRVAAVVGRSVDHRLLAAVVGVPEGELLGAVREATDQHVLVPSAGGVAYMFRHALLREAIYDDTLVGERLGLHRAIAETLSAHPGYAVAGAAAELAYHWHAAGDERAALSASVEAASEAVVMHAHGEALRHVERALEVWDRVEIAEAQLAFDRIELLLRGSKYADDAGEAARALELAEQARAGLDERSEPLRAARAERTIGRLMLYAGRGADGIAHMAQARRLVPKEPPSLEYLEALSAEGRLMMVNDRMREARPRLEEAVPLAERLGERGLHVSSLSSLALVYANLGQRAQAISAGREAVRLAATIDAGEHIVRAYINGSQGIDDAGRIEEALEIGLEGIALADRLGMSRGGGAQLRGQAAWRLQRIGRLGEAERMLAPVLEHGTAPFMIAGGYAFAGRIAVERGEFERAQSLLEPAWDRMQRSGGFQLIGPALSALVLLDLRRRDLSAARERAREGLRRVMGSGSLIYSGEVYWLAVRVEADLAERARLIGDRTALERCEQEAVVALSAFDEAVDQVPGDGAPPEALAFRALARAELSRLRGERDPEPWKTAAAQFRAIGLVYPAAYADLRSLEAHVLSGTRTGEIAPELKSVHMVAVEVGAKTFIEEVEALARRTGISLAAAEDEPGAAGDLGLTNRELEVLRLLADGRTNRQIGEELFITPKTASVHVSRILMKLGVANRAEAAAAAHRLGLAREHSVD